MTEFYFGIEAWQDVAIVCAIVIAIGLSLGR